MDSTFSLSKGRPWLVVERCWPSGQAWMRRQRRRRESRKEIWDLLISWVVITIRGDRPCTLARSLPSIGHHSIQPAYSRPPSIPSHLPSPPISSSLLSCQDVLVVPTTSGPPLNCSRGATCDRRMVVPEKFITSHERQYND